MPFNCEYVSVPQIAELELTLYHLIKQRRRAIFLTCKLL